MPNPTASDIFGCCVSADERLKVLSGIMPRPPLTQEELRVIISDPDCQLTVRRRAEAAMRKIAAAGFSLMPVPAGAKVVELLANAVEVSWDHSHGLGDIFRPELTHRRATIKQELIRDEQFIQAPGHHRKIQRPGGSMTKATQSAFNAVLNKKKKA